MNLDSIRNEYKLSELSEKNIDKNPIKQTEQWINNAINAKVNEATAMSVSTIGSDGFPQSRVVLLKDISSDGFTFFTNYESSKGKSLKSNPAIGLLFFWPIIERQIRISGFAENFSFCFSELF